jgi:hypothetical protein
MTTENNADPASPPEGWQAVTATRDRTRDGQYSSDLTTECRCGHIFGQHTAYKGTNGKHDCCEDCSCPGYKRASR